LKDDDVLMLTIKKILKNQTIQFDDVISKKILAQNLIADRINDIEKERNSSEGWKPKLPIEIILNKIFQTIPKISFSYPTY
jgi:hypothetical protein